MNSKTFIFLLLIPTLLFGQRTKDYTLHFDINDFAFTNEDGITHIASSKNYFLWGDIIDPSLPHIGVNILVAPTDQYDGLSVKTDEMLALTDAKIEPNPIPVPTGYPQIATRERLVQYKNAVYPKTEIEYTGTHQMDGYKYLSFVICPFRYDALNRQLFLKTNITISIQMSSCSTPAKDNDEQLSKRTGKNMRNLVKEMVVNGNQLETMYDNNSLLKSINNSSSPYEYVIVTNNALRSSFEKLAHWKTLKGVRTKVITVEECCTVYPNYTSQLAIKSVLATYYANGMEYALLGGDTDVVPIQTCYLPSWTIDTNDTPADLYYACLDNCFSWDANGNHIYGETDDNIDLAPEFIVTRASVSNIDEANTFVNRIIEYESAPNLNGWAKKMLSCGNFLHYYLIKNGLLISDAQNQGEYVYENGVQNYWDGTLFKLFDTYTDNGGAGYEANAEHLQTELEKGYTFVDEFSHAWANTWGYLEDSTKYKLADASSLVNSGYTTITTISCYSNSFDKISTDFPNETHYYTICLSEAFLRNPNSGVLAYLGSSREGWNGYSHYFDEKFYESLLSGNDKQFGRAAMAAKTAYLGNVPTLGFNYYRWLIMTLNPLGDPEMPIYTCTPQKFTNVGVVFTNGSLTVTTGVSDCNICVSSVADNGISYYERSGSTNSAYFSGITDDCYLCITKTGYVPYIARVGSSVYLQNETIANDLHIFSTTTYAGHDVTISKPQGPVVIETGKVSIKSQGTVTLKNSFEVKTGAELEIINP